MENTPRSNVPNKKSPLDNGINNFEGHPDLYEELKKAKANYDLAVRKVSEINEAGGVLMHPIDAYKVNKELEIALEALKLAQLRYSNKMNLH